MEADNPHPRRVHFATMDGTALSAVDFLPVGGAVELSTEQPEAVFTVSLVDDPRIDGAKEFSVRLFELNPAQEVVILDEAEVLIHDNEKRLVLDPGFRSIAMLSDGKLIYCADEPEHGRHVAPLLVDGR